jgi:hypothetical protein
VLAQELDQPRQRVAVSLIQQHQRLWILFLVGRLARLRVRVVHIGAKEHRKPEAKHRPQTRHREVNQILRLVHFQRRQNIVAANHQRFVLGVIVPRLQLRQVFLAGVLVRPQAHNADHFQLVDELHHLFAVVAHNDGFLRFVPALGHVGAHDRLHLLVALDQLHLELALPIGGRLNVGTNAQNCVAQVDHSGVSRSPHCRRHHQLEVVLVALAAQRENRLQVGGKVLQRRVHVVEDQVFDSPSDKHVVVHVVEAFEGARRCDQNVTAVEQAAQQVVQVTDTERRHCVHAKVVHQAFEAFGAVGRGTHDDRYGAGALDDGVLFFLGELEVENFEFLTFFKENLKVFQKIFFSGFQSLQKMSMKSYAIPKGAYHLHF